MIKKTLQVLALSGCLSLAACGGGGSSINTDSVQEPVGQHGAAGGGGSSINTNSVDEINASNALLVASIADFAVGRYFSYKELTTVISGYALSYAPPIPSSVSCYGGGSSSGQLETTTLSSNSFNVALLGC